MAGIIKGGRGFLFLFGFSVTLFTRQNTCFHAILAHVFAMHWEKLFGFSFSFVGLALLLFCIRFSDVGSILEFGDEQNREINYGPRLI